MTEAEGLVDRSCRSQARRAAAYLRSEIYCWGEADPLSRRLTAFDPFKAWPLSQWTGTLWPDIPLCAQGSKIPRASCVGLIRPMQASNIRDPRQRRSKPERQLVAPPVVWRQPSNRRRVPTQSFYRSSFIDRPKAIRCVREAKMMVRPLSRGDHDSGRAPAFVRWRTVGAPIEEKKLPPEYERANFHRFVKFL